MSDKSAEQGRVDAESGRVVAEKGRVVNESSDETGRIKAEQGRVTAEEKREARSAERVVNEDHRISAEKTREHSQRQYENELEALRNDPEHYMTPGARKYFRRVSLGYIILAVGCVMGIWALTQRADEQIRHDINSVAKAQCLGSIPTLTNYNAFVDIQIDSNRRSRTIAEKEHDAARVVLTTTNIIKLQKAHIRVPNAKECDAPLLK
jgi:ferric-dicitrate binding protein FerR (iron transport regulator)